MSWLNPPIEKVIERAGKYILCSLVSKRAKELLLNKGEFFKDHQRVKPVEYASREYFNEYYTIAKQNKD